MGWQIIDFQFIRKNITLSIKVIAILIIPLFLIEICNIIFDRKFGLEKNLKTQRSYSIYGIQVSEIQLRRS